MLGGAASEVSSISPSQNWPANLHLLASASGIIACAVRITTAFVTPNPSPEAPLLFARMCGAGFALASAHAESPPDRLSVSNRGVTREATPVGSTGVGADGCHERSVFRWLGALVVRWPWAVIGVWLAIAVSLPPTFPSLTEMVQRHPVAILPADAPVSVAAREMTKAFHESGSENVLLVVLTKGKPGPADENAYRKLVDQLRQNTTDVVMLQDFVTTPALREVLTSEDNRAWIVPVGIAGDVGSTQAYESYKRVAAIVKNSVAGSTLAAHLTGPAATDSKGKQAGLTEG